MFGINFDNILGKRNLTPVEKGLNAPGAEEKLAAMKAEREIAEQKEGDAKRAELQERADKGEIVVKH